MKYTEEADYTVTLTLRITTRIAFSPMERDSPITKSDAIENAIGLLPQDVFDGFGGEFELALPIDGEATRLP